MYQKNYHIHFVGIGGIGMSGIAELLLNYGYKVSGSDIALSSITKRLEKLGGIIYQGHKGIHVGNADVVVISSAISNNNPEVVFAQNNSITIIPRAEMLAEIMRRKYSIAVSGAHGKTSTTSIISQILNSANLDPTVIIGGILNNYNTNALYGKGDYILVEADESDGSFLKYSPCIAVITNIDMEHLNFYKDIKDIKENFIKFINSVPFYGMAIIPFDDEHVQDILLNIKVPYITFGENIGADVQAQEISFQGTKTIFKVFYKGQYLDEIKLNLLGRHNISNALAGISLALKLNISFKIIKKTLKKINGVKRRMEFKGEKHGVVVIDDYGHHPTEIKTTLEALCMSFPKKRLVVVFQPHRYSRTKALFNEFLTCFDNSDVLIILPIYAASEEKIKGVSNKNLCKAIKNNGDKKVFFSSGFDDCLELLLNELQKGDIFLTLGAGDVYSLGERFLMES